MEIKNIASWDEFENQLQELGQLTNYEGTKYSDATDLLFRGQSNAQWRLSTTLERYMERVTGSNKVEMWTYYLMMSHAKSRIETFTANTWDLPDHKEYLDWLIQSKSWHGDLPALEYMAYLRHHGFPSPLLDWSMSPFVAAYFAFRDVTSNAESVAIFAYTEMPEDGKRVPEAGPNIVSLMQDIRSDRRHFLQQSTYTICTAKEKDKRYYCSHEEVFAKGMPRQDLLWKFILPSSESRNALRKLDTYNINAYSIFQSEDSVIETVFLREYVRKRYF